MISYGSLKPARFRVPGDQLWSTPDAHALVEYLLSLKREFLEDEGLSR